MASRSLGTLTLDLVMQMGGFEQGMDKAQRATDKFSKGIKKQQNDLDRLIGKIDPVVGRLSELDRMEEKLRNHHKDGLLPKDDFDLYLKKITELRDATGVTSNGFRTAGKSARELAWATRGLPAQFTDIAVSLQGGQRPLTVFLQQGGQLKDMFGGIGPAAKAMGGYIAGLVNPYTVAAAAIAGVGYAAYSTANQFNDLNKSLALAGRGGSESLQGMQAAAYSLHQSLKGVSIGTAAKALATVAANGKIAYGDIEKVASVAAEADRYLGKSVEQTASEYADLKSGGVDALYSLNEKYNFLTLAQYEHIKKLYDTGHAADAAKESQRLYLEQLSKAKAVGEANLTPIEQLWQSITDKAREAGDAMAYGMGFGSKTARSLLEVSQQINDIELHRGMDGEYRGGSGTEKRLAELKQRKAYLEDFAKQEREAYRASTDDRSEIGLTTTRDKLKDQYLKKDKDRIAEQRKALISQLDETRIYGKERDKILAGFDDQNKLDKTRKSPAFRNDSGTSRMQSLRETEASLRAQLGTVSKLTSAEQDLARFNQQIADLKDKKQLTAEEKSLKNNEGQLRQQYEINAELSRQVKHHQDIVDFQQKASRLRDAMSTSLDNQRQQQSESLAGFGLSDRARSQLKEQQSVDHEYARYRQQAMKLIPQGMEDSEKAKEIRSDVDKQKQAHIDAMKAGWDAEAKARGDWQNGMTQAWGNYLDKAQDVASSTRGVFESAFGGMEDSLANFVKTGKLSFSSLVDSIIDGLAHIAVQQAVLGLAGMLGGSFASGAATGTSGTVRLPGALGLQAHADGGFITGPGTGKSDSIPAMLSNGEFVVNAAAVEQPGVRDMLEMVNARKYAAGGYVASSGYAGSTAASAFSPQKQSARVIIENITVDVTAQQGMSERDAQSQGQQIAAGIMKRIAQETVTEETTRTNGIVYNALKGR